MLTIAAATPRNEMLKSGLMFERADPRGTSPPCLPRATASTPSTPERNQSPRAWSMQGFSRVTYEIPTRGLLGLKNALLSSTKGTAVLNTQFLRYDDYQGSFSTRELGSLVAFETGQVRTDIADIARLQTE